MSTCHFCGEGALQALDEGPVCYDCCQRLKAVPNEERLAHLIESLQKVHGTVLSMRTDSPYKGIWLESLARRLAHAQGVPPPAPAQQPPKRGALKVKRFR